MIAALAFLPWRAIGIGVAAVAVVGVVGGSIHSYGSTRYDAGYVVGYETADNVRVVVQQVLDNERLAALREAVDAADKNLKAAATLQNVITETTNEIFQADERARVAESLAATRLRTSQTIARAYTQARDRATRAIAAAASSAASADDRPDVLADVYGRCASALERMGSIAGQCSRRHGGVIGIYDAAREVSLQP